MIKRVTSFTYHRTGEGYLISYTYSKINDKGDVVSRNARESFVVTDSNIQSAAEKIEKFIQERLDSE